MRDPNYRTGFFLTLLILVTVLVFLIFRPYLVTLAMAGTFAVILHPLYEKLLSYVRKRGIAAGLMVLFTFALVLLPFTLIGLQIASEAQTAYDDISSGNVTMLDLFHRVETVVQNLVPGLELNLDQYISQGLQWMTGALRKLFTGTINTIIKFLLGSIAYYYMFKDGKRLVENIIVLSPLTETEDRKIAHKMSLAMNSVIRGSLIIALLQGIVTGIGLMIFGVPSPVLFGSLAAAGALIPTAGTAIVIAPLVIYLFATGSTGSAIGLALWGALAVGLLDNFLHPMLVGQSTKIHPAFIFFSVIGGIAFFGMAGFILGPLTMTLFFALLDIFRKEQKQGTAV